MEKTMLINVVEQEEERIAILQDDRLEQLYLERTGKEQIVGNIYKGIVVNLVANIEAAFIEFAARQVAVLRGIGYRGAHIGGFGIGFEDVRKIIDTSEEIAADWRSLVGELAYPQPREYYHFRRDPDTGLNSDKANLENDWEPEKEWMLPYRFMKLVHNRFFDEGAAGFSLARALCRSLDKSPRAAGLACRLEKGVKWIMNDCQECGDCSLTELAFLCPESQCGKYLRNGPCGGSLNGICELEDRPCVWVRVFNRLERAGRLDKMLRPEPVFRDPALNKTSSWINFYLGRDHKKVGKEEEKEQQEKKQGL